MKLLIKYGFAACLMASTIGCNIDSVNNPNGPTVESYIEGASQAQLQLLATGLEAITRNDMEFYYQTVSIVGREYYDLNGTDPRYTGELLGAGDGAGVLDNNGFLTTRSFTARYRTIRNGHNLIASVENSAAGLSDAEKRGFYGFARTIMAYEYLLTLNRQYNNGIRNDISDPDNLGPFTDYAGGLGVITTLLDQAISDLSNAGESFAFDLSGGFSGFDTPATFSQFAQAIKARVRMYAGDKQGAIAALNASFIDMAGDLNNGVYHVFSGAGNDRFNPLFYALNQRRYMVHPSFINDAEAGDTRLNKTAAADTVTIDGLAGSVQTFLYKTNVDPVALIRNEELILLMAEANIPSNPAAAINALNVVRQAAGLSDYSGGQSEAELVNELLRQRRYSLFGEGHRWIDMRRYDRLDQLPLDRPGDEVFVQFPRPLLEEG